MSAAALPVPEDVWSALAGAAASRKVLVVGTLNMDTLLECGTFPQFDSAVVVERAARCPGGHAGNSATGLAKLGLSVRLVAAVGSDSDGERLIEDLQRSGIDAGAVRRLPDAMTGQVYIPTAAGKHYMLLARGANDLLSIDLAAEIEACAPDAVVLFDPPRAVLAQVPDLRARGAAGPRLYWCPGPLHSRDAALCAALVPSVDVVVLNRGERRAIDLALRNADMRGGRTPEWVTTMGAEGAVAEIDGERMHEPAHSIVPVDTVGSGDAFLSAYVLAREAGLPLQARLRIANGYGALAAGQVGARAGLGGLDDLRALMEGRR